MHLIIVLYKNKRNKQSNGWFSKKEWLIFERNYGYVWIFFCDRDGSKMEVTKVPAYVALKGCEISAQSTFLILNNEWFSLILLLWFPGEENESCRKQADVTMSSIKHQKQSTASEC